uniref:HAT C-terminal dimerisation domain-containing protein n=1 Tax=Tanacetum cinerariifolium TaxID=118510 RepID=A0A6L2MH32_TANCI|nr:hypothetical protein [Tanacetum cinerariifolium]
MASGSASVLSVESTFVGAKRKSKEIGWEYGVIPDPRKPDRIKCTLCQKLVGYDEKILDQAKKLTIFIYSHHKMLALMRDFTKKRDIVRPGVTRFASSFLTLQSLSEKKEQLRHMFSSTEWEECRFSGTVKGKAAYATVLSTTFWAGESLCLKVFTSLVKVLQMVDADWKPSMGFVYGEMIKAKEEIQGDTEIQHDPDVSDAVLEFFEAILAGDLEMQLQVTNVEMPKYKKQTDRFANWWGTFGGATPNLKKIAMRILSLTSSSSGCERNWSTTTTKTTPRELFDEEFESGSEEVVYEGEYESDGVKIIEDCGDEE